MGPPDSILGITEAFRRDDHPKKVNVGVGAYRDDDGKPYILPSVRKAEEKIRAKNMNKEYLPIGGTPEFCLSSIRLALGSESQHVEHGLYATAQCLSGTGSLRVGAAFLREHFPGRKVVYLPVPTWENHNSIFKHAGFDVQTYKYYDPRTFDLNFNGMMDDITASRFLLK